MKNEEIHALWQAMQLARNLTGPQKFGFGLAINRRRLQLVVEAVEEQRQELLTQHAKLDEVGQRQVDAEGNVMLRDAEAWRRDWAELMALDSKVELHRIALADWPSAMPAALADALLPLLPDDEQGLG